HLAWHLRGDALKNLVSASQQPFGIGAHRLLEARKARTEGIERLLRLGFHRFAPAMQIVGGYRVAPEGRIAGVDRPGLVKLGSAAAKLTHAIEIDRVLAGPRLDLFSRQQSRLLKKLPKIAERLRPAVVLVADEGVDDRQRRDRALRVLESHEAEQ